MNNGAPRFLFIGNLTRRKGAYDLVDAFAAASRRGGFAARAFLAGGETDLGQKEELLTYIDQSGCTGSIELLGLVHGQQKHSVLSGADCLVLPSYAEGLPMVVLEGMSYGLPIIASHVGAIPEVVRDGTEGFILSPGDVPGLANRIALLAADPALRRRMGQAARRRVEERYSMEVACEAILGIYREAMSRRNEVREA
jgi:glycosyltransferase involved in cell wall biosynthesis